MSSNLFLLCKGEKRPPRTSIRMLWLPVTYSHKEVTLLLQFRHNIINEWTFPMDTGLPAVPPHLGYFSLPSPDQQIQSVKPNTGTNQNAPLTIRSSRVRVWGSLNERKPAGGLAVTSLCGVDRPGCSLAERTVSALRLDVDSRDRAMVCNLFATWHIVRATKEKTEQTPS